MANKDEGKKNETEAEGAPKAAAKKNKLRFNVKYNGKMYAKGSEAPSDVAAVFAKEGYLE